jgi:ubiquinone/menaquinone biosynthesis C-methylase UbiE
VFIFGDVVETQKISQRLLEIINSLPSKNGVRVLEIGCGTGVAAREIVNRIGDGKVLAIDRSSKAIEQAINSASEISNGRLQFIQSKIEEFELPKEDQLYDIAFASRVGALDLRHPEINKKL